MPPIIVTCDAYRLAVAEQLTIIGSTSSAVLIEPDARNTAPAILAAALWLKENSPSSLMLVMPSDHQLSDDAAFHGAVRVAAPSAIDGDLIAFGTVPNRPETGYGYLELAHGARSDAGSPQRLNRFIEKPDKARANEMLASGKYLWNAGIFLFSVDAILAAYALHAEEMLSAVAASFLDATHDLPYTRLQPETWRAVESISIDYAIMEKADNLAAMPYTGGWSDLGDWASVWREGAADAAGNVCSSSVSATDCSESFLKVEGDCLHLVGIGLKGMIAVATPDAVLVAPMSESQRVGEAVSALRAKGVKQAEASPRDQRPWGWFESIVAGERFQVRRVMVKPRASFSRPGDKYRARHWIVVAGTAQVNIGDQMTVVSANQSIYLPPGAGCRLENTGKLPITMIEVETGEDITSA